jgi:hypothetical protein
VEKERAAFRLSGNCKNYHIRPGGRDRIQEHLELIVPSGRERHDGEYDIWEKRTMLVVLGEEIPESRVPSVNL